MAKEISREFHHEDAIYSIVLRDDLGGIYQVTIYIDAPASRCPHCQRAYVLDPAGVVDVDATIEKIKNEMDARAERLRPHVEAAKQ